MVVFFQIEFSHRELKNISFNLLIISTKVNCFWPGYEQIKFVLFFLHPVYIQQWKLYNAMRRQAKMTTGLYLIVKRTVKDFIGESGCSTGSVKATLEVLHTINVVLSQLTIVIRGFHELLSLKISLVNILTTSKIYRYRFYVMQKNFLFLVNLPFLLRNICKHFRL